MNDPILNSFLHRQREEALALARASDLVEIWPIAGEPPNRYRIRLRCKGLVRRDGEEVREASLFELEVWFPSDYLRRADPFQVLTWIGPREVFHPNISAFSPLICIGRLIRGTPLVDIVYRCFDVITYNNVTMVEQDSLNKSACEWARQNRNRFPIDTRPLKRRTLSFAVERSGGVTAS